MLLFDFYFIDVDSAKLDLSKELANDFSNPFDSLIDATDLHLNVDDFVSKFYLNIILYFSFFIQLLNAEDLSVDPNICDDAFRMER
jgi:hypothetical protein